MMMTKKAEPEFLFYCLNLYWLLQNITVFIFCKFQICYSVVGSQLLLRLER